MLDSKEKKYESINQTENENFRDEVTNAERKAFLEGYRYAIIVLEENLVKDRK